MNLQQKNYALNRATEIKNTKINELKNKCTTKAIQITKLEKLELIAQGKVKIKKGYKSIPEYQMDDIHKVFDFSSYEKPEKFDDKTYNEKSSVIIKKVTEIKDKIMLGDAEEALRLLSELEKL